MSNSLLHRLAPAFRFHNRAAAATAGLCASALLATAGVATAAGDGDGGASPRTGVADIFVTSHTAELLADSTRAQAGSQHEAARAAEAEKRRAEAAERRAEAEKRRLAASWVSPISGDYVLSASYADSGSRWAAGHSGQDFAVPSGTPVRAAHDGTVVKAGGYGAGDGPAYGNAVVIDHGDGTYTQYAHLSSVDVSAGERVGTGDRIARSGNTGNSTGPHLHFEVRTSPDYGSAVNPVPFLHARHVGL